MKYFGLDPATTTGWSFFEDGRLIEKNSIVIPAQMDLPQKLNYFHIDLSATLNRLQPDYIFIEDVILGISGAKTLAYLARINGVAISTAYSILRENVRLYSPTHWKSHSFDGLSGMAKKWQIQLAAVNYFNIPISGDFGGIDRLLAERDSSLNEIKKMMDIIRTNITRIRSSLNRKRNPVVDREEAINNLKIEEDSFRNCKKIMKSRSVDYEKKFNRVSIDIAAQTGLTENIADSMGIALCGYKELVNANQV